MLPVVSRETILLIGDPGFQSRSVFPAPPESQARQSLPNLPQETAWISASGDLTARRNLDTIINAD
jgi:hypothetical protein